MCMSWPQMENVDLVEGCMVRRAHHALEEGRMDRDEAQVMCTCKALTLFRCTYILLWSSSTYKYESKN